MNLVKNKYLITGILGVIGLFDAAYLTIIHYQNVIPPCTIKGCEKVLTSELSTIAGVPLSLMGAGFYITVIILSIISNLHENMISKRLLKIISAIGLTISILLLIDQLFIIRAVCQYCLISLFTSVGIFAICFGIKDKPKAKEE